MSSDVMLGAGWSSVARSSGGCLRAWLFHRLEARSWRISWSFIVAPEVGGTGRPGTGLGW